MLVIRWTINGQGTANGIATLGSDGKVPSAQLPASGGGESVSDGDKGDVVVSSSGSVWSVPEQMGCKPRLTASKRLAATPPRRTATRKAKSQD